MSSSPLFFNPYQGLTFVDFILRFFYRVFLLFTGQIGLEQLATDEIQVFVLIGVAASSGLIGVFLVLRRMTMLANALAHTVLMGIVLAYVFSLKFHLFHHDRESFIAPMEILLIASILMGFVTSFLTEFLTKTIGLQADASTGFVFTALFAIGIILATVLTRSAHIGTEAVMGNADALHLDDLKWVYAILAANFLLIVVFFRGFKITTFDPSLACALGFSNLFFNYLLMAQASATTIGAFRAVGVFLVLGFITGPVLTARLLTHDLKKFLFLSVAIGSAASLVGVALTRHILTVLGVALSTSGLVVCVISVFYLAAIFLAPERGLWANYRSRRLKNQKKETIEE